MKHLLKPGLFALSVVVITGFNSFGQCPAKSNYFINLERAIRLNSDKEDCWKFMPTADANNLTLLSATKITPANLPSVSAEVVVQGRPDMVDHTPTKENGMKFSWQVSLQITCAGASNPRIGYGPTRLYYAAPFEKDGSLVEFVPGRSFGYGEADKSSVTLLSEEFTEGGARVFPRTEFVRCDDMDNTKGSMIVKDIDGATRNLVPQISFLNHIRYARPTDNPKLDPNDKRFAENTDEELDRENLPAGKFLLQCFLVNINPKEDETFQLILRGSSDERAIRTYKEKDGQASCETYMLEKPGPYLFLLRWFPYRIESNRITLNAVGK